MQPEFRKAYNDSYTEEAYEAMVHKLVDGWERPCPFRICETPLFMDAAFTQKLVTACEDIVDVIVRPDFKQVTERAIPQEWKVANENDHPHFIAIDFALTKGKDGTYEPQLIELQGFPSLYGFQAYLGREQKAHFPLLQGHDVYYSGLDEASYTELLRRTIIGPHQPEEVALMDVHAVEQKTAIDFFMTREMIGISIVALEDLIQKGNKLYYLKDGKLQRIKRLYNRLIFDEISGQKDIFDDVVDIRQPLDVEWVTHPSWFYRISKFTMPFLHGDYVPETRFLNEVKELPADLDNYVLKPLFSFAGQGVIIDVTPEDIASISDPENWILQKKVVYEQAVMTPQGTGVKAEIRMLYLWPDGDARPTLATNLVRLSLGKMAGVRYNQQYTWVGSSSGFIV